MRHLPPTPDETIGRIEVPRDPTPAEAAAIAAAMRAVDDALATLRRRAEELAKVLARVHD